MPGSLTRLYRSILFLALLNVPVFLYATHQRAAEITFRHLSGLTYEITLISYTNTLSPVNNARNYLEISWGDGTLILSREFSQPFFPTPYVITIPRAAHLCGAILLPYVISCEDPNRNLGIMNIPNSVNIPMFIYSELYRKPLPGG